MNAQPNYQSDAHHDALDLSGLEGLLERAEVTVVEPVESVEEAESLTIMRLLDELHRVMQLVQETSSRLMAANERMSSLSTLVTIQNKQLELLTHYQLQASKVAGLEARLAHVSAENERLKRPLWRKLVDRFKRN